MSTKELSSAINHELVRIGLCAFIFEDDINDFGYYTTLLEYLKKEPDSEIRI